MIEDGESNIWLPRASKYPTSCLPKKIAPDLTYSSIRGTEKRVERPITIVHYFEPLLYISAQNIFDLSLRDSTARTRNVIARSIHGL